MDSGISSVKTLLYIVLVLALLAVGSNFYVASLLDRNSQELASLRLLLQKQMMGSAITQAEEMQKKMQALNESASGIDFITSGDHLAGIAVPQELPSVCEMRVQRKIELKILQTIENHL